MAPFVSSELPSQHARKPSRFNDTLFFGNINISTIQKFGARVFQLFEIDMFHSEAVDFQHFGTLQIVKSCNLEILEASKIESFATLTP